MLTKLIAIFLMKQHKKTMNNCYSNKNMFPSSDIYIFRRPKMKMECYQIWCCNFDYRPALSRLLTAKELHIWCSNFYISKSLFGSTTFKYYLFCLWGKLTTCIFRIFCYYFYGRVFFHIFFAGYYSMDSIREIHFFNLLVVVLSLLYVMFLCGVTRVHFHEFSF